MKAVLLTPKAGESADVGLGEIDEPRCGPGQVKIDVRAASVNRADLAQRAGTHGGASPVSSAPVVAGLDAAGEIVEIGPDVPGFRCGDRVMVMVAGGLAQRVVVDHTMLVRIPVNWSYVEGAGAVLGFMTAHNALASAGRMSSDDVVLVHAAGSGVGMQAIQLARHLGARSIVGTTRSDRSHRLLEKLGADHMISTHQDSFEDRIAEFTDGHGADVIVDLVGGPYLQANVRAAAVGARLVSVGRLGGPEGLLDIETIAYKRIEIIGVTFRTRSPAEKARVVSDLVRDVPALGLNGESAEAPESLRPHVFQVMDWTDTAEAHRIMVQNDAVGKIVLEVR